MQIEFYNFSKRSNSTKIPDVATATTVQCQLKDETSFLAPVILVKPNLITGFAPSAFNYAHIPYWLRYYYIADWKWINGIWEAHLTVDALGSFRSSIGNMSEYILRSSYEKDGTVVDSVYVSKTNPTKILTLLDVIYISTYSAGFFILGVIGNANNAAQGAITYYQMTASQIAYLIDYMLSVNFLNTEAPNVEFTQNCLKLFFNAFQYIVSCTWYPFAMSAIPSEFKTAVSSIRLGWWPLAVSPDYAYRLSTNVPVHDVQMIETLQPHPQINRGSYLNHNPYTSYMLHLSPFGDIQIPNDCVSNGDKLEIRLNVDMLTGIGILSLYILNSSNVRKSVVVRTSQKIGVEIQLAQVASDVLGQIATINNAAYSYETGQYNMLGSIGGSILNLNAGGVVSGISEIMGVESSFNYLKQAVLGDVLKTGTPQVSTSGHNGTMADYKQPNYLESTFFSVVDADNTQLGSPLCKIRTISAIPGYIVVGNPDVSITGTESEKSVISQMMAGGFFYE